MGRSFVLFASYQNMMHTPLYLDYFSSKFGEELKLIIRKRNNEEIKEE
jgi:hypothetical protein